MYLFLFFFYFLLVYTTTTTTTYHTFITRTHIRTVYLNGAHVVYMYNVATSRLWNIRPREQACEQNT